MSTIREVARLAGVSTATVSRVLNNDTTYKMRDETRQRVWQAVAEAGYKAKQPPTRTRETPAPENRRIGCVLSVTKDKYRDPYFTSIFSGIEEGFAEKGYSLAFLKTYFELQDKHTLAHVFEHPPAGLIMMETLDASLYRYMRARVGACVGVDTLHDDIDNVGYDQFETAANTVRFLISRGHKEIAFIGGSGTSGDIHENKRYLGYFATMKAAGLTVRDEWVYDCQWDEIMCIEQVKEMMADPNCPTAIYAASDLMAVAALSALYSMKINVPGQVAVMGLSNIELSQFSSPPLSTYEVPTREIGLLAVDLLDRRLNGSTILPQRIFLPTKRILRASV